MVSEIGLAETPFLKSYESKNPKILIQTTNRNAWRNPPPNYATRRTPPDKAISSAKSKNQLHQRFRQLAKMHIVEAFAYMVQRAPIGQKIKMAFTLS